MRGDTHNPNPAGGVLDDRQDVHPLPGQRHGFEEVGREDGLSLGTQERRPGLAAGLLVGEIAEDALPAATGPLTLYLDDSSIADLWIGLTWGGPA